MSAPAHGRESPGAFVAEAELFDRIRPLLGRRIAFHRLLVDLTHSVKAALLLSQALYWTRHGRQTPSGGGWFFKTTTHWQVETGLSAREQARAREKLAQLGVLEDQRMGMPARLHFRVCLDALAARLGHPPGALGGAQSRALLAALGPAVAYYRTLAALTGGVHPGLLLSHALGLTGLRAEPLADAWLMQSAAQWSAQIGLTRREQEAARRTLIRCGLWEERRGGVPPVMGGRVLLQVLLARLGGAGLARSAVAVGEADELARPGDGSPGACRFSPADGPGPRNRPALLLFRQNRQISSDETATTDSTKPRCLSRPKREIRFDETDGSVSTQTPDQFRQKRDNSVDGKGKSSIYALSTRSLVQEPPPPRASAGDFVVPDARCGGGDADWIYPAGLQPDERDAARSLLARCPAQAQALLDELAGRLQGHTVHSPVAYLRGLVERAENGLFVPELGLQVARARQRRAEEQRLRREREAEEARLAAERASPEHQARLARRRAELCRLREAVKGRSGQGGGS